MNENATKTITPVLNKRILGLELRTWLILAIMVIGIVVTIMFANHASARVKETSVSWIKHHFL
jgi:hypothetical protein